MSATTAGTPATAREDYSSSNGSHRGDDSNKKNASPVTIGMSATAGKQPPSGRGPTAAGIPATVETTGIYELQQGYQ
jgi:hypothetical protein